MRILIVDDELLVRIGIKSCIEWHKYGMEIVGEASDGAEALQKIKGLKPQVVLLDLKMPNMDGLEVMARIRQERLQCKIIILSGFDDIFHVKEAMKLGAVDYLHKPCMNPKDIVDILQSIKKEIEQAERSEDVSGQRQSQEGDSPKSKNAFLKGLLKGCSCSDEEFRQKCQDYGINLENGYFSCILFSVKDIEEVRHRYEGGDIGLLQTSVLNISQGIFQKEEGIEILSLDVNTYALITGMRGAISQRKIMDSIEEAIKCTLDAMKQFLNVDIVMGASDVHVTFKELKRAYKEATKALKYKFYAHSGQVIHYRDIRKGDNSEAIAKVDMLIEKLKGYLTKYQHARFNEALEELVVLLKEEPCLSEEDVKKLFNAFLFMIKEGKAGLEETESLNKCQSIQQLHETWTTLAKSRLEEGQSLKQYHSCSFLVKGILSYIDGKYFEDITLNALAEHFNVTPNYISRIFKEETGEALFNYLNLVRIDKAKEFLKESGVKIYEVGFKVGFKSSVHFNIVFNKLVGLSPKQYRDSL